MMKLNKIKKIQFAILLALSANGAANAEVWVTSITNGTATFDDWGYAGPDGRTAMDFGSVNGFGGLAEGNTLDPTGGVGQIQHVVTTGPDGLTPDAGYTFSNGYPEIYTDASMDSQVNFYDKAYTTVAGSTFNNMQIDYDGDYLVRREDMSFEYYRTFEYTMDLNNPDPDPETAGYPRFVDDGTYDTAIQFKPYALSDATGWCGSVTASNPGALEAMAGQVQFDFAFESYMGRVGLEGDGTPGEGALQIVPDFQMRSYGSLTIETEFPDGSTYTYTADAVVNNTNPTAGAVNPATGLNEVGGAGVDEDFYNQVSFMGGGSVPGRVFVRLLDTSTYDASTLTVSHQENIDEVFNAADEIYIEAIYDANGDFVEAIDTRTGEVMENVVLHNNAFSGYGFILRADGLRIIDAIDFTEYGDMSGIPASAFNTDGDFVNLEGVVVQDLSAVPVPAAVWLFGSGLIGLIGAARRKKLN
ncbi:MAG: VPLPA-CTERM sorting domain-containing protein [Gammaproteobacteria bacterium]|nr:VPLPA-CTERM sorting domain-containing protein [Gammaproteobacteria bacterium]